MSRNLYTIIAGVGPGTGSAIAKKFARTYTVVLLARNTKNLEPVAQSITSAGGTAICVEADVTKRETIENAIRSAEQQLGEGAQCTAAIFNAAARPAFKPFLETSDAEFMAPFVTGCQGAFTFSQSVLPHLLKTVSSSSSSTFSATSQHPPTLIFTGATASLKGSAKLAPFAAGKTAQRALAQSIAREFGPQGVHVSHVIIDGIIDTAGTKGVMDDAEKIAPETIAETYWYLHTQPRTGFTFELEIRPAGEKW